MREFGKFAFFAFHEGMVRLASIRSIERIDVLFPAAAAAAVAAAAAAQQQKKRVFAFVSAI